MASDVSAKLAGESLQVGSIHNRREPSFQVEAPLVENRIPDVEQHRLRPA
jgi:hypothetical protein